METDSQTETQSTQTPQPLAPSETIHSMPQEIPLQEEGEGAFRQIRRNAWYLPSLALCSLATGYTTFFLILKIEGWMNISAFYATLSSEISPNPSELISLFVQMATTEWVTLGTLTLLVFALSRRYFLPTFLYIGYLLTYTAVIFQKNTGVSQTTLFYLNPVFISATACALLWLGLRLGKKVGLGIAVIMSIIGMAFYNTYVFTHPNFRGFPFQIPIATSHNSLPASKPSSTEGEAQSWKIYRNEKYGFEFKYHSDWVVDDNGNDQSIASFGPQLGEGGYTEGIGVKIYYWEDFPDVGRITSVQELRKAVENRYREYLKDYPNVKILVTKVDEFDVVIADGLPGYVDNESEAFVLLDQGLLNVYPGNFIDWIHKIPRGQ